MNPIILPNKYVYKDADFLFELFKDKIVDLSYIIDNRNILEIISKIDKLFNYSESENKSESFDIKKCIFLNENKHLLELNFNENYIIKFIDFIKNK